MGVQPAAEGLDDEVVAVALVVRVLDARGCLR